MSDADAIKEHHLRLVHHALSRNPMASSVEVQRLLNEDEDRPIALQLPKKMTFKVAETMPAVAGNTASGNVTKEAKTDNGFMIKVPLFIAEGESVIVNTDTGEYVERA